MEKVILVNEKDRKIGEKEKLKVHQEGLLHRAVSVFVFNKKGEILIQKRAKGKYHSPGLWANTCCTHPRVNEKTSIAAKRRLKEEMGIETTLKKIGKIKYKAKVGDLIEHEIDHIFFGFFEGTPKPNPKEVESWRWIKLPKLQQEFLFSPQRFAPWFKIIFKKFEKRFQKIANKKIKC